MKYGHLSTIGLLCSVLTILYACQSSNVQDIDYQPDKMAENYMLRGVEYMKLGKYDIALNMLKKALRQDENYANAHGVIAVLYENLNEFEQAHEHHKHAINLNPADSDIQNNYGQFLCKQGEWQAADQHFLEAVKNPVYRTPYIPYTNAALCALHHQKKDKAETYLRKALQLNPKFEMALYQMAELAYEHGRYQEARGYLHRYLEVAKHIPQTLWLGILIERALNNRDQEASYALRLRSQYPDSEQVHKLNQLEKP